MTLNERYQVHERIGEGGMALVYRATDLRLNRKVAVKMLRPQYAGDPDFVARFEQEATAAAGLSHPNIAAVYDTGEDQGTRYIVMEHLRPFTLKDLIGRSPNGRLTADDAIKYGAEIAAALQHAHQRGVVHRDIKPQNILFTDDGHVKVTDFGIARALAATSGTATGTILGSPHYISPEQARGDAAGPQSDLYSLGVVLYEMLTGRTPYQGETPVAIAVQHLRETPTPLRQLVPDIPPGLDHVVQRAMAKDLGARYASAEELRAALLTALAQPVATGTMAMPQVAGDVYESTQPMTGEFEREPEPEPYRRTPPPGRPKPILIVAFVVLVTAAVIAGMMLGARGTAPDGTEPDPAAVEIEAVPSFQVPDLVGQNVDTARDWVEQYYRSQNLIPPQIVEAERRDDAAPENQILEQSPAAGTTMEQGGVLRVVVSSGQVPARVPSLVGLRLDRARRAIEEAGLMLGTVTQAYSDTYVADVVMSQTPAAETQAVEGSAVELVVSLGPEPVTPEPPTEPDPETPEPPSEPPSPEPPPVPEVSLSIGQPTDVDGGLKQATVVVSVPDRSPARKVELRWLAGGNGTYKTTTVAAGGLDATEVRGTPGAVLGIFIDGEQKGKVEW